MLKSKRRRTVDDQYSAILQSLTLEEQQELFAIKRKYNWIINKLDNGIPLRKIENEWLQTRPHYIASERIGVDLVEDELIYVR